jgi:tetratricopeptide (TPR) repeat protein
MHTLIGVAALIVLLPCDIPGQENRSQGRASSLGTVALPNSGNSAAQAPFLKGIALLHSFEYDDAASAFREAQEADPSLALAYYGEALTHSRLMWRFEDLRASRAVLRRLGPGPTERIARARTPFETRFASAAEKLFETGPLPDRVLGYAKGMRELASAHPSEPEALAFAAHAVLLEAHVVDASMHDSLNRDAIGLARRVVQMNPRHPGGTHYLIHLYDSPSLAKEGLAFARAYDKIAPDAEHALHMPSHIYLQLGMWDDVVRSNERAWAASRARTKNPANADWHAFAWLHYGYLQQGRIRQANSLVDSAEALLADVGSADVVDARFALVRLQFQHNVEASPRRTLTLPLAGSGTISDRERGFAQQVSYWRTIDAAARRDRDTLSRLSSPYLLLADSVLAGATVAPARAANALVVRAMVAGMTGGDEQTVEAWRAAVRAESRLVPFTGPPDRVFAGEEWMASILQRISQSGGLTEERRALIMEALPALENVLRLCPERSRTLYLLATAADVVGAESAKNDAFARLAKNYRNADNERRRLLPSGPGR